jgi:hypothetical protein
MKVVWMQYRSDDHRIIGQGAIRRTGEFWRETIGRDKTWVLPDGAVNEPAMIVLTQRTPGVSTWTGYALDGWAGAEIRSAPSGLLPVEK